MIYSYNDVVISLIRGIYIKEGINLLPTIGSFNQLDFIDPLSTQLVLFFYRLFGPILTSWILFILTSLINILVSYSYFKLITTSKKYSVLFSLIYSFSIFYLYRVISFTPNLYFTFVFPLILILLIKNYSPVVLALSVFTIFGLSSYFAFFCFLLVVFWKISQVATKEVSPKKSGIYLSKFAVTLATLVIITFSKTILNTLPIFKDTRSAESLRSSINVDAKFRPIENWYNLSFRPWYFVIPPKHSLFFEVFSRGIHQKILSTNNYLADDYMEEEMAGSYLGWHVIFGVFIVIFILLKRYKNFVSVANNAHLIKDFGVTILLVLAVSCPPSITFSGYKIYTPSYLMYLFFPVFRTLVRFAPLLFLLVLSINIFLLEDLDRLFKTSFKKSFLFWLYALTTFFIFAIKIPLINVKNPPPEVQFLAKVENKTARIAAFPKASYQTMFWTIYHKHPLVNPPGFINYISGFDTDNFTNSLSDQYTVKYVLEQQDVTYLLNYDLNSDYLFSSNFIPVFMSSKVTIYKVKGG